MNYEIKQVIVMRTDLNMRKGKMIAQGAHASMQFLRYTERALDDTQKAWLHNQMAKICVRVDSEEELDSIIDRSIECGLECHLVTDAGHTEFHGNPTKTCIAIGPDYIDRIDQVTGHLKLL